MAKFTLRVNGTAREVSVDADAPLLYVLRNDLELNGAEVRLRPRAMRRLHRAGRRHAGALVRDAGRPR